jgi:AcrR family transcriptional regulator
VSAAPKKEPLSRERILAVASELTGREGLAALSMRRLAQELDVWPMSVYRYFRDKDELVDAIAAEMAGAAMTAIQEQADWATQLRGLLTGVRAAIARDPETLGGRLSRAFLAPETLALAEAGLAILNRAGLEAAEAARAWRALWSYTVGFAGLRLADTPAEARRLARVAVAGLPDAGYPHLLSAAEEFASAVSSDDEFDHGLDLLLAGVVRASARSPSA